MSASPMDAGCVTDSKIDGYRTILLLACSSS